MTGTAGEIFLKLGVLGGDENDEPIPNEGIIGLDVPISIPFFAEPCDIDADGVCDVDDLNQLLAALGTGNSAVNLDPSRSVDRPVRPGRLVSRCADGRRRSHIRYGGHRFGW